MKVHQEDVQHRILVSARQEFAAFGLAGARIDRIAQQAHASKERLYAYFSDKVALFHAVLDLNGQEFYEAVTLDPADVPGFVGNVFDHSFAHPEHLRMMTWARLDGIDYTPPSGEPSTIDKLDSLRRAQHDGHVDPSWDVENLLPLLFSIGLAWAQSPDPHSRATNDTVRAGQRRAAVTAAERLVSPGAGEIS